ncbi:MAG: matrixin family metalloprotease [Verrucomicrobia bacterium]|nr:matrixin family metalloprotease [Verrucomicrobiota bacterium]
MSVQWLPAPVRLNLPLDPPDDLRTFWAFEPPYSSFLLPETFNKSTAAIRYYLGVPTFSEENQKSELDAIRAAIGQWQSIPDSRIRFEEAGLLSEGLDINLQDGKNLIFWAKSSVQINGGTSSIRGIPAVSLSAYDFDGSIIESDIVLNAVDFTWRTTPAGFQFRTAMIEPAMLHELGHFLGLAHSAFAGASMYFQSSFTESLASGLSLDEVLFARDVYGTAGSRQRLSRVRGVLSGPTGPAIGARVVLEDPLGLHHRGDRHRNHRRLGDWRYSTRPVLHPLRTIPTPIDQLPEHSPADGQYRFPIRSSGPHSVCPDRT